MQRKALAFRTLCLAIFIASRSYIVLSYRMELVKQSSRYETVLDHYFYTAFYLIAKKMTASSLYTPFDLKDNQVIFKAANDLQVSFIIQATVRYNRACNRRYIRPYSELIIFVNWPPVSGAS